jgi:DNA-binding transcriptional LysR family regulator
VRSANADLLREAAIAGSGMALLADWLVREDVRPGACSGCSPTGR